MAISEMRRLSVVATGRDSGELMRKLQWLGCVELTPSEESGKDLPIAEDEEKTFVRQNLALESALTALKPYRKDKTGLFEPAVKARIADFDTSSDRYKAALAAAEETARLRTESASAEADINRAKASQTAMQPWLGLDTELSERGTKNTRFSAGVFPPNTDLTEVAAKAEAGCGVSEFSLDAVSANENGVYATLVDYAEYDDKIQSELNRLGFLRLDFTSECQAGESNRPSDIAARAAAQIKAAEERQSAVTEKLTALAPKCREIELAADVAQTAAAREAAKRLVVRTEDTSILSGWVPRLAEKKVSAELDRWERNGGGAVWYEFSDPAADDVPPVLLDNPTPVKPFETVVGLYSLPAYGSFDPTLIMSIFYFVIFGLMLGDVLYGLALTIIGFWAAKKLHLPDNIKNLCLLFGICGISCTVCGVLFGSYFGDLPVSFMKHMFGRDIPSPVVWFDATADPITFLIVSFVIGGAHLLTGMGIQFYNLWRSGHPFSAIFDIGSWYVLFAGIGCLAAGVPWGKWVAIGGVAMLVLTQGRAEKNPVMKLLKGVLSLYNLVSYISDLLSYSRIMALGLASAVIAQVVNLFATMGGNSVIGWILFPIVLIGGHLINLLINLLGTFVHDSRLQYIEFFGKFYVDGGVPFRPVKPELKYTEIDG